MKSPTIHVGTAAPGCPVEQSSTGFPVQANRRKGNARTCISVLLLCIAASAQTPAPEPPTPFQQTAVANEKILIAAKKKDDATFFKQILAPDFILVGIDGKLHEKQEAIDELGDSEILELTPYDIRVVALGDAGVIISYDAVFRKAPEEDQGPPPRYQHFSSVWIKQGDQWKLKFHQATAAHWGDW